MKTVAIIGTGIMGRGMAMNLKKNGVRLRLFSRSPDRIADLRDENCSIFTSISEAATGSNLTILCLTEDDVVRMAFFESGLLDAHPGAIIDTGTTSPDLTLEMADAAQAAGIPFLDAPMTGSKLAAASGQILFMVGGDPSWIETFRFFFDACGKNVIHCGPVSSGQRAKIALNMIQAGLFQIYLEGFHLAFRDGIDAGTFMEILRQSAAASPLLEFKLGCVLNRNFEPHFALKNMNKDMNHAMKRAQKLHTAIPLSSVLKSIYDAGMAAGQADEDFCSLARIMETLNHQILEYKPS
jgi:3-hydroxyisobutyrate dehydrogenase